MCLGADVCEKRKNQKTGYDGKIERLRWTLEVTAVGFAGRDVFAVISLMPSETSLKSRSTCCDFQICELMSVQDLGEICVVRVRS